MQTMLERALEIAREAHAGQVDKAGCPVIEHVLRVVDAVEGDDAKVVAALHDVLEPHDGQRCPTNLVNAVLLTTPERILEDVLVLRRGDGQRYAQYINDIRWRGCIARIVKVADLRDHLHPDRIGALTPSHAERYRRALRQLGTALAASGSEGGGLG